MHLQALQACSITRKEGVHFWRIILIYSGAQWLAISHIQFNTEIKPTIEYILKIQVLESFWPIFGIILLLPFQDWSSTDDKSGLFRPQLVIDCGNEELEMSLLLVIAGSDDLTSFLRFVCLSPFLVFNF